MKRKPPPPQEPAHKFQNAEQEYLFAILQGIFWPAFMVYEGFSALAG